MFLELCAIVEILKLKWDSQNVQDCVGHMVQIH